MTPERELELIKRDAYEAGFKAYLDGCSCRENPFANFRADGENLAEHWESGWSDSAAAFRQRKG